MSTTRVRIDPDSPATFSEERFDPAAADGTTEAEIAMQQQEDDAEAMQDMARYARRVRRRLGLSQVEVTRRINVPHEAIRNCEQGKRLPQVLTRLCCGFSTRGPKRRCACRPELAGAERQGLDHPPLRRWQACLALV